jgi:glutamine synthetase adenylyltransferase
MSDTDTQHRPIVSEEFTSHARTAAQEARHAFAALMPKLPEGFVQHQRAARHEMLQAMRSLLDAAIERNNR